MTMYIFNCEHLYYTVEVLLQTLLEGLVPVLAIPFCQQFRAKFIGYLAEIP